MSIQIQNRVTNLAATAHHFDSVVQEDFDLRVGEKVLAAAPLLGTWQEFGTYEEHQLTRLEASLPLGAAASLSIKCEPLHLPLHTDPFAL